MEKNLRMNASGSFGGMNIIENTTLFHECHKKHFRLITKSHHDFIDMADNTHVKAGRTFWVFMVLVTNTSCLIC